MVHYLFNNNDFPDPCEADESGLVAVGGKLTPETLIAAYKKGIFPWFNNPPILWYSLSPRMVLLPEEIRIGRTLRNIIKKRKFEIKIDTAFSEVIKECALKKRDGQDGSWIGQDMIDAYCQLHKDGYAHSCEAWLEGKLVGGLYGISLGKVFYGESMFAHCSDASKVAFVHFVQQLQKWEFHLIDCQMYTEHLARFGAELWSQELFQEQLKIALTYPTRKRKWKFEGQ